MVRPRRLTADDNQAGPPAPIPASYYARPPRAPAPPPAGARTGVAPTGVATTRVGDLVAGIRRRWIGLSLIGGLVVSISLIVLVGHGLASNAPRSQPDVLVPPVQAAGPIATDTPTATPTAVPTQRSTPRPTPRRTPAPTPVTFLNGPLSAHRGDSPTLLVRTAPATSCTITLGYPSAPQLSPATSDASGAVSWTWKVTGRTVTGTFPITVSCGAVTGTTQIVLNPSEQ